MNNDIVALLEDAAAELDDALSSTERSLALEAAVSAICSGLAHIIASAGEARSDETPQAAQPEG